MSTEIIPYLFYRDVPAALDWLATAFGFEEENRHPTESGMHASMLIDGKRIMMGQGGTKWHMSPPEKGGDVTCGIFVYVPDVKAVFAKAEAAGAQIEQRLEDHGYGLTCTIRDLDGHPWFFTQRPD